jgi:hypothetical protein
LPAAGTRAVFNSQDFGTSCWQLRIEGYINFSQLRKSVMAGLGPSIHLPQRSIIPAIEALSVKTIDQSKNYK